MFDDDDSGRKSHDEIRQMPIYKKAQNIADHVQSIVTTINEDDLPEEQEFERHLFKQYSEDLVANAYLIPAKISGAEGGDLYGIRMENAAIIRKAARDILTGTSGLRMAGFKNLDYLELLRDEIEEFRVLFAEWVKTFDAWNYIKDDWGLFNPPGINYDDQDPDDDIPFDPNDFDI